MKVQIWRKGSKRINVMMRMEGRRGEKLREEARKGEGTKENCKQRTHLGEYTRTFSSHSSIFLHTHTKTQRRPQDY